MKLHKGEARYLDLTHAGPTKRRSSDEAMAWTKRMLLASFTFFSIIAWFKRAATAEKRRFMDIKDLREAVIEIIRRKPGVSSAVADASDPAKIIVRANEQTFTADLSNLMNRIRAYPDENPDKLIHEFTASIGDLQNRSVGEENLIAVLRDKAYVDQISKIKGGPLIEPFVGELMLVYMADMPGSMSPVARNEVLKDLAELRTIALSNIRKWLGHVKSDDQLQVGTLYFVEGNTMLSPTLILLDEFWTSIKDRYSGDVLIAVPRRDQLFIFNDNAQGAAVARRLINITFQDNFSLLSDQIFARRDGRIVAVKE
jgi:uncharacterized protein YtpQ (UPF0354 family)